MVEPYSKDGQLKRKPERKCDRKRFKRKLPTVACKTRGRAFMALISDISANGAVIKTSRRGSRHDHHLSGYRRESNGNRRDRQAIFQGRRG